MEIGCSDAQIRAYIGGMVTVPTARAVLQLLVEHAAACTSPVVGDNDGKKPRKATVATGQHTPSVSERRPPLSSRVPASNVGGVSSFAHTVAKLGQPPEGSAVVVVVPTSRKSKTMQILDSSALGVTVPAGRLQTGKIVPLVQHLLPGQEMALAGRCITDTMDVWVVAALSLEDELN
jgi:hypothetical protein